MSQRRSKRKRSTTAPRTTAERTAGRDRRSSARGWSAGVSTTVKAVGALAGTIVAVGGAVKLLSPSEDPHDDVAISSITAVRQPLGDFHPGIRHDQGSGGAGSPSATIVIAASALDLLAQAGGDPSDTTSGESVEPPPDAGDTTGADPGTDTQPATQTGPDDTTTATEPSSSTPDETTTTSPARSSGIELGATRSRAGVLDPKLPIVLPDGTGRIEFTKNAETVLDLVEDQVPSDVATCKKKIRGLCAGFLFSVISESVDEDGEPVAPDVAARRLVTLLHRTRTIAAGGRQQPQGLYVTAKVRLVAMRDKDVSLTWSVLPVDGRTGLGRPWDGPNLSYRLKATDDDDHIFVPLWIPLPKRKGRYVVRLSAFRGDTILGQSDSRAFR